MRSGRRRFVVAHSHSLQSSNRASPMDALIRAAVERVTEEPADGFDWSESLTTAEELAAMLQARDERSRIDLLWVTDHVNETTTAFHPDLVALAAAEPRVGLGAEIQTVAEEPPGSGRWVAAPEVLVYGGPDRVAAGSGWRYGLDEPLLAELQSECRPPGAPRAEVRRLLAACRARGLAHAVAHPLDGHACGLATTLEVLASSRFVETVNGGFSGDSTRRLERYLRLHAAVAGGDGSRYGIAGGREPAVDGLDTVGPPAVADGSVATGALAGWLVTGLAAGRLGASPVAPAAVAWGGSDAHLGDYARVRVAWDPPAGGAGGMGDLLRDMAATPPHELLADRVFAIDGCAARLTSCLGEVLRLVARNAVRNRHTFRGPRRLARLAAIGPSLAIRRVLELRRAKERLGRQLDAVLAAAEAAAAGARRDAPLPVGGPAAAVAPVIAAATRQ